MFSSPEYVFPRDECVIPASLPCISLSYSLRSVVYVHVFETAINVGLEVQGSILPNIPLQRCVCSRQIYFRQPELMGALQNKLLLFFFFNLETLPVANIT